MLNLRIYQINSDRDVNRMLFERYDNLEKFQGSKDVNSSIYDKVWEGSVEGSSLEDVYVMFNRNHPEDFKGHSLSVSDVVEVVDSSGCPELVGRIRFYNSSTAFEEVNYTNEKDFLKEIEDAEDVGKTIKIDDLRGKHVSSLGPGFYFCDSYGFKKVEFEPEKTKDCFTKEMMKVLFLEPGKVARAVEIGTTLKDMHNLIGGYIETCTPYEDGACIVFNRDARNNNLPLNRAVRDEKTHEIVDIIAGSCFICDGSGEKLAGLSDEQLKKYETKFRLPEEFVRIDGEYDSFTYDPTEDLHSEKTENTEYTFVASKSVADSDGFLTDYSWYEASDGTQVFVFGDNDVYKPEDGYFDHVCESNHEAQEWFDSYEGFVREKPSLEAQIQAANGKASADNINGQVPVKEAETER